MTITQENKFSFRELWLSDLGRSESDVMTDADGLEYIKVENESELGDDFQLILETVALPDELQRDTVLF